MRHWDESAEYMLHSPGGGLSNLWQSIPIRGLNDFLGMVAPSLSQRSNLVSVSWKGMCFLRSFRGLWASLTSCFHGRLPNRAVSVSHLGGEGILHFWR